VIYDEELYRNYTLADPRFNKSDRVDVILGADLYGERLENGIFKRGTY
jgi:hypothetical protein